MSSDTVRIYSSYRCGWAIRNYAALIEKQVGFSLIPSRNRLGEKTPEFLSLSPLNQTPVLQHRDTAVWDSQIINDYIEDTFPEPPLMPVGPRERARLRNLNHYCDSVLMPLISRIAQKKADRSEVARLKDLVGSLDDCAFSYRGAGPYCFGAQFTLVDIAYLNLFDNLSFLTHGRDLPNVALSPNLQTWKAAIEERPSVIRARQIAREFLENEVEIDIVP